MRKLRLKKWVKVALIMTVLFFLILCYDNQYKKSVEQCVNAGNTQDFCENGLR